jgi:hypothetical protein
MKIVSVHLSEFAREATAGEERDAERVSESVVRAIRCYLGSTGSRGSGWSYPSFLRVEEPAGGMDVQLSIDEELWRSLEEEAEERGVSMQQMVIHATLWFAAELDAGRITRRIVKDLDEADEGTRA